MRVVRVDMGEGEGVGNGKVILVFIHIIALLEVGAVLVGTTTVVILVVVHAVVVVCFAVIHTEKCDLALEVEK